MIGHADLERAPGDSHCHGDRGVVPAVDDGRCADKFARQKCGDFAQFGQFPALQLRGDEVTRHGGSRWCSVEAGDG